MRSLPEQVLNGLAEYETENYREDRKLQLLLASLLRALASREVGFRERLRERQKLDELLYRLLQQMPEKFQSKEELFSEFAKANFTGNYLPLARLIEKSMGKGSFRRLAKEFGSADSGK